MFGGVEAGGTKFVCVIGTATGEIVETQRVEVTGPDETLDATIDFFRRAIAKGRRLDAIGIGSFGPIELRPGHPRYGSITTTPKAGWSGTPLVGPFVTAFGVPVGFDTDVNAAALAEGRWGAPGNQVLRVPDARDRSAGARSSTARSPRARSRWGTWPSRVIPTTVRGRLPVPRRLPRREASGPAVAARYGRRAEHLEGDERRPPRSSSVLRRRRHPLDRLRARARADRHRRRPVRVAGPGRGGEPSSTVSSPAIRHRRSTTSPTISLALLVGRPDRSGR